ncbi:MAG TPA: hypothetical protein VNN10_12410 [Dehalococcoidia bacterium]|nr:hypothetical protein [Dehalococcoidia bacterium]
MNKLLLLAFLLAATVAFLSLRKRKVKFEIEFEMEPGDETEEE